ncbi:YwqJ-related putative deaminase [Streptomyces sp. TRM 70351]|uniref:YwqJ-related putative deaminase n=1 Tax=Streptomyces sp. TRM 70351 TaxID=3116552 RepID=UPI002E7B61DC|nr:YwqJ-related putative deaminase [Streptomyces sp. TRM 70351]MEE1930955.1 YwqJ-related putative deaminase [Streptomyces sp. TRM 70351]
MTSATLSCAVFVETQCRMRRTSLFDPVPRVASSLLVRGRVLSHTNLEGGGRSTLHPAVQAFFEGVPGGRRTSYEGRCAETALISDQFWYLEGEKNGDGPVTFAEGVPHFRGAAMVSRRIEVQGNPAHGKSIKPCAACVALIDALEIRLID